MKILGMILIAFGLFGLAWGGVRIRPGKRLSISDPFMLLATRHIAYRCLRSQERWRLSAGSHSCLPGKEHNFRGRSG
jgi:hypothetical protein